MLLLIRPLADLGQKSMLYQRSCRAQQPQEQFHNHDDLRTAIELTAGVLVTLFIQPLNGDK